MVTWINITHSTLLEDKVGTAKYLLLFWEMFKKKIRVFRNREMVIF